MWKYSPVICGDCGGVLQPVKIKLAIARAMVSDNMIFIFIFFCLNKFCCSGHCDWPYW